MTDRPFFWTDFCEAVILLYCDLIMPLCQSSGSHLTEKTPLHAAKLNKPTTTIGGHRFDFLFMAYLGMLL